MTSHIAQHRWSSSRKQAEVSEAIATSCEQQIDFTSGYDTMSLLLLSGCAVVSLNDTLFCDLHVRLQIIVSWGLLVTISRRDRHYSSIFHDYHHLIEMLSIPM